LRFLPSHRRNLKMRWNWAISEASTKWLYSLNFTQNSQ
jgi:hypothetical protein